MTSLLQTKREHPNGFYTFSSRPHVVPNRIRYTDPVMMENDGRPIYGNIMYDRRVVRGNTYSQHILPATAQPDPVEIQRQQEAMQRAAVRKGTKFQRMNSGNLAERKHVDVQTELYLEELSDHIEDASVECQTDAFLDKPATPIFIPAKSGKDAATQIEDGELFDFDLEVEPVLQVLVGKTIEQALLEVLEEEELAGLRAQQLAFQELRNAELVEVQRLEEQERRHKEEKARRIKQQRMVLKKERETAEKIAARTFTQHYLADLLPAVYSKLRDNGYFYDPVQRDIETGFLPWLVAEVNNILEKQQVTRTVLDMLIQDVAALQHQTKEAESF
ncbi:radial spoke head protein 3 homolog [Tachysurus vachellii]|uniref:radial spoke head protein 3 homolog n=1 Tax=Tachysurus vachellii TaxID=175792 RepID=UPI00296B21BF|nr:radial spoke head protein 3 homolog [Tachysurus vachellii]